jgi:hypothetical protein
MKQKPASQLADRGDFGDVYTFVALDADTKLVPCFHVGRRTWSDTATFIDDLRSPVIGRPQIATDAFAAYYGAIRRAFESRVDYAQQTKVSRFRVEHRTLAVFAAGLGEIRNRGYLGDPRVTFRQVSPNARI